MRHGEGPLTTQSRPPGAGINLDLIQYRLVSLRNRKTVAAGAMRDVKISSRAAVRRYIGTHHPVGAAPVLENTMRAAMRWHLERCRGRCVSARRKIIAAGTAPALSKHEVVKI
jgi:hypothetical protein